jgi:general secretion pathway protein F
MSAITLDQLLALNDEIASLVRAGVPLEKNLGLLGDDMPGRLGDLASQISDRAMKGESLDQIISSETKLFPPVYRAVIEAGRRAGRLPAALESLAGTVRRLNETRRAVLISALYPLLVMISICFFFAFFTMYIAPAFYRSFAEFHLSNKIFFGILTTIGRYAPFWGILLPTLLLLGAVWVWWESNRSSWIDGHSFGQFLEKLPGIGSMIRCSRNAAFTEMLATLVAQDIPLHEAMVLAADASGSEELRVAVGQAVQHLKAGQPLNGLNVLHAFPPLLRWMIPAATSQNILLPALNRAAAMYHHRAEHLAESIRVYVPILMVAVVAGGMTLAYALCLFAPYAAMLRAFAR